MENPVYVGLSRMVALNREIDVVANNVANVSTPGYKGENSLFLEYVHRARRQEPVSLVNDYGTARDTRQGALTTTGNPLDVAVMGEGYLTVRDGDDIRYTRAGHFILSPTREIVTAQGRPVLSTGGTPVQIPIDANRITIAADGTVSTEQGVLARLNIVGFDREQEMRPLGDSLYATDEAPRAAAQTTLSQGMIENSNVQPVMAMTRMIDIMRSYQNVWNLVTTESQRQLTAIQRLSSVN